MFIPILAVSTLSGWIGYKLHEIRPKCTCEEKDCECGLMCGCWMTPHFLCLMCLEVFTLPVCLAVDLSWQSVGWSCVAMYAEVAGFLLVTGIESYLRVTNNIAC